MRTIIIGVDPAKQVFSVCEMDSGGRIRQRKTLRRQAFAQWLAQVPAGTAIAMEACSGAQHKVGNRSDRPEESLTNKVAPSTCRG